MDDCDIIIDIGNSQYYWNKRGGLRGWFTKEELEGKVSLPSAETLFEREVLVSEKLYSD